MPSISAHTTVNATPQQAFDYLADFRRHKEWAAHPLEIKPSSEGAVGTGYSFTSESKMMGKHHSTVNVTAFEAPGRLVYVAEDDTGRWQHEFLIRPAGNGNATEITKTTSMLRGSLMNKVMATFLLPFVGGKIIRQDMVRIKGRLEGGA